MRTASPILRSRRLVLVAAAVVLGLSACGSDTARQSSDGSIPPVVPTSTAAPTTTSPPATIPGGGPPPIRVGDVDGVGASPAAGDSLDEGEMSADTKMRAASFQFIFDGEIADDLTSPAAAWYFPASGDVVVDDRIAALAAAFGLDGPVEMLEDEFGGGKTIGADDFSGPSVTVGVDAMQSWWYSAGDAGVASPVCEAVTDDSTSASEAPPDDGGRDGCVPLPPVGVPSAEEAEAATTELMSSLGFDPANYEFETYADEWGASANAYLVLDGVRSNVSMYFSYGGDAILTWAGGFLATPERGEDYPRIGVAAAIERLNAPNWLMGDLRIAEELSIDVENVDPSPVPDTSKPVGAGNDASEPIEPVDPVVPVETLVADLPVEIDPIPCDLAADCIPTDMEPLVVHIRDPHPSLEQLWAHDGTVWLLPAYSFASDDQGIYSVIAVEAAYLLTGDAEPAPEPAVDTPLPMPDTVATDNVEPGTSDDATTDTGATTASPAEMDLTGLTVDEATRVAEQSGWSVRVVREDGVDLAVTMDFRENRMNVAVVDGLVTELVSIG